METLPYTSAMVQFLLFKTPDLALGEYIVMQRPNLFDLSIDSKL